MYIIQICISLLTTTLHEFNLKYLPYCLKSESFQWANQTMLQCQIQKSSLNAPLKYELVSHGK